MHQGHITGDILVHRIPFTILNFKKYELNVHKIIWKHFLGKEKIILINTCLRKNDISLSTFIKFSVNLNSVMTYSRFRIPIEILSWKMNCRVIL